MDGFRMKARERRSQIQKSTLLLLSLKKHSQCQCDHGSRSPAKSTQSKPLPPQPGGPWRGRAETRSRCPSKQSARRGRRAPRAAAAAPTSQTPCSLAALGWAPRQSRACWPSQLRGRRSELAYPPAPSPAPSCVRRRKRSLVVYQKDIIFKKDTFEKRVYHFIIRA